MTENTTSGANKTGSKIEKDDLKTTENDEPMPSTSHHESADRDEELEPTKMFKKSTTKLQLEWCRKQPDFIQRKETIQARE